MEKWMKRAVELLSGLVLTCKSNPSVVSYIPQKTAISGKERKFFKREKPEKLGVSSMRLYRMLAELEGESRANIHSVIVLKDGVVISEASAPGYDVNVAQLSHSMTKSIIGMAIGFLVDENKLSVNERLVDIFPEYKYVDEAFPEITVKHLLTMGSGVKISEAGSVTEDAWTEAFFASKLSFRPGLEFRYNSMNSYILAKIVEKRSGMGIMKFLRPRLFSPLEIDNVFWELGPEGLEKGGWGIYLSPESWAKLGYLMLSGGSFFGKRVLSEKWVKESTLSHAETSETLGDFNYGYQLWRAREGDDFLFNGMLGQNTWISPKNNVVVVLTAGNNELFQSSPALDIVRKYLASASLSRPFERGGALLLREKENRFFESRRSVKPLIKRRGLKYLLGFGNPMPYDDRFNALFGRYAFPENNQGILPAFVRVMQNNYMGGIECIRVEKSDTGIIVSSKEGGTWYKFRAGFYGYEENVLDFGGEKYMLSSLASAEIDREGRLSFKIELVFPELPNTRVLILTPLGNSRISLKMLENPNQKLAMPFLETMTGGNKKLSFALDFIEKRLGEDFLADKIAELFEPTLTAVDESSPDFNELILEERLMNEERLRPGKMLSGLISQFVRSDSEEEVSKFSLVSGIFGFMRNKNLFFEDEE
ncbi:MAG: serine hydrolase [Clostridia bacterium]|nr:serine hydrolase [Clostridia bacterium]